MRPPDQLPPDTDLFERLLGLEPEEREQAIERMGQVERDAFDRDWKSWAHQGQLWPEGDWRTWVIMAGRGFGKTLTGAHWITAHVATREKLSIALVAATLDEARRVMVEGRSGLIEVADAWIQDWNPSLRRLSFRTGAVATLFSGHSPEILRGPEHHIAWCDELAKWEKAGETWDMLQLGLRLGEAPRTIVTTTPRPGPVLKRIMAEPGCVLTRGSTFANPHTAPAYKRTAQALYAGTRLGRQELEGELLTNHPGALWTEELLEKCRAGSPPPRGGRVWVGVDSPEGLGGSHAPPLPRSLPLEGREAFTRPAFVRVVIAVDPPSGDGTCGIVACAKDEDGRAHILADHSVTARSPEGWARAVADAAAIHSSPAFAGEGDRTQCGGGAAGSAGGEGTYPVLVVAESNQGGEMVKSVLRTADPSLAIRLVAARHGKSDRASPVAMLFEAGKVTLHGRFPELEAELCGMIAGGGYEGPGNSPDRADAMVWALTELMLQPEPAEPRLRRL